jgi:hypothetical protein
MKERAAPLGDRHGGITNWVLAAGLVGLLAQTVSAQAVVVGGRPVFDVFSPGHHSDTALMHPIGAQFLGAGIIAVADVHGGRLLFFDTLGHRRNLGAEPKRYPFKHIAWIGTCGSDSLFVWDLMASQIAVIDTAGAIRRVFRPASLERTVSPAVTACSRTGMLAQQGVPSIPDSTLAKRPFRRAKEPIVTMDRSGREIGLSDPIATGEFVIIGGGAAPNPLAPSTSLAFVGDDLYVGTADAPSVDVYSAPGARGMTISVAAPREAPTERHRRAAIMDITSTVAPVAATVVERALNALPMRSGLLPPYTSLQSDGEHLWVLLSSPGDDARILVLNRDGSCAAKLELPLPVVPSSIQADRLVGTYVDASGTPHIAMFAVRWQRDARPNC